MGEKLKSRKKGKAMKVALTTALVTMPFVGGTPLDVHVSANELPPPVPVNEISNMVIPLNGYSNVIDLKTIFRGPSNNFEINSSNLAVANLDQNLTSAGLLKINPATVGTASFTIKYSNDGLRFVETFDVTVDDTLTAPKNFDIVETVKKIIANPSQYSDANSIKNLLSTIGPAKAPGTTEGNHAPYQITPSSFVTSYTIDKNETDLDKLKLKNLQSFFADIDGDEIQISIVKLSGNSADIVEYYPVEEEGGSEEEPQTQWKIDPKSIGTSTFKVFARDGKGGVVSVGPVTVNITGTGTINHPPVLNVNNPFNDREVTARRNVSLGRVKDFFTDADGDNISVSFASSNSDIATIINEEGNITLVPHREGIATFSISYSDGYAQHVGPNFTVTVKNGSPVLNLTNKIVHHFSTHSNPDYNPSNAVLHLSNNSEIDLSEMFTDPENDNMHYEIKVLHSGGSAETLGIEGSIIRSSMIPNHGGSIDKIFAYDSQHEVPTELDVSINNNNSGLFPDSINGMDMYESNAAGTSSFIVDYRSRWGIGDDKSIVSFRSKNQSSVTASVYEDHYLKFDAALLEADTSSAIQVLSVLKESEYIMYQSDFTINVISPYDTQYSGDPAISFSRLYPSFDYGKRYYGSFITSDNNAILSFETGSFVRISQYDQMHTQTVFIIDPEFGSRKFIVPFIKPIQPPLPG
ncbi:hypothetical protein GCM10008018_11700 [Paenibacillus marchantiophytorum]|uniref:Uncharacterized protein n=1 Tax=Paenibacillus marchantiophytorum TaxID=1619310 RepID=A0ABQ2BQP8_9BACL|nr:hypothetical protein [Paenibacillus marchantiophytorum]GGI45362.1 hypothetical protein GCM10008018_11700 [Paenibacillus marchantiophytorum]